MASQEKFAQPLESLAAIMKSAKLSPDFITLAMPSAVLHEAMIHRFTRSIFNLLEQGFSVHIEKIYMMDHALPQERAVITLLASASANLKVYHSSVTTRPNIQTFIKDLSFENPRKWTGRTSFVCRNVPSTQTEEHNPLSVVYNHQTGRHTEAT